MRASGTERRGVVVLGAGGQVGRELVALGATGLARADGDLADEASALAALDARAPDVVINCAAYTGVDQAEREPEAAFRMNAEFPGWLGQWCARRGVGLVHVSTDYVFDGTKDGEYVEDDPVAPLGVYGTSKEAGEQAVRASGASHAIVRTSWVVGRYGNNFVRTIARLARERDLLRVVADQYGRPTPSKPLAAALLALAQRDLQSRTYHFAGDPVATWWDVARFVAPPSVDVRPIATEDWPTAAKRPLNSALDCTRWLTEIGIALPDWRAGVREILEER